MEKFTEMGSQSTAGESGDISLSGGPRGLNGPKGLCKVNGISGNKSIPSTLFTSLPNCCWVLKKGCKLPFVEVLL